MEAFIYTFFLCNSGKNLTCMHRSLAPPKSQVQQVYKCERRGECKWTTIHPPVPSDNRGQ